MSIQFTPLWETMRRQNLTTYSLIQMGFSKGTLHRLKQAQSAGQHPHNQYTAQAPAMPAERHYGVDTRQ